MIRLTASEPARTERNLAHPLTFWKRNAADFLEAYSYPFCGLAGGTSKFAIYFDHFIFTCQLTMAILSGLGKAGILVGVPAKAQVQTINGIQFIVFLYVWCLFPAYDRVDNLMYACQFALEGTMTAILSNQGEGDFVAAAQEAAFVLSLLALAVPLLRRFYDGVIVPCITMRRQGPFDMKNAAYYFLLFAVKLQASIMKLIGIEAGEGSGVASTIGTYAAGLTAQEADEGAFAASIAGAIETLGADAKFLILGSDDPQFKYIRSALTIQNYQRARVRRSQARKRLRAVTLLQAGARRKLAFGMAKARLLAVIRVQTHQRGKVVRNHVRAFTTVKLASWTAADESFESRPGLAWVMRQEALHLAKDRIERIKQARPLTASHTSFPRFSVAARQKINPRPPLPSLPWSIPWSTLKLSDEELTEPMGDCRVRGACRNLPPARMQPMQPGDEFHSVAGVVFMEHELSQQAAAGAASLQGAVNHSRREIARSMLPAAYPPGFDNDESARTRGLLRQAARGLQEANHTVFTGTGPRTVKFLWSSKIMPAMRILLGYAFLGTQTFPAAHEDSDAGAGPCLEI